MKILILGAEGNLGTQLVKVFKADDLLAWDRQEADFLDFSDLQAKLIAANPDLIINAAAYNAVDKCEEFATEKVLAVKLNVDLPTQLAKWCQLKNKTLVHFSTDYVFSGRHDKQEFVENDEVSPTNIYGQTKAQGEAAVVSSGANYYLIRVSKLFGPAGRSEYSKKSFFDVMYSLALGKSELKVVDEELSCFTYTPDLAEATKKLIENQSPFGIYHLINEGAATWYQGVLELKKILNFSAEVVPINSDSLTRPARRPKFSVLKNTKAVKLRPYQEALRDYLKK
ncbi:MAG: dTDP-4-dehydrorhamnose reductase [Candidatus Falkowbacteria bacterium]